MQVPNVPQKPPIPIPLKLLSNISRLFSIENVSVLPGPLAHIFGEKLSAAHVIQTSVTGYFEFRLNAHCLILSLHSRSFIRLCVCVFKEAERTLFEFMKIVLPK